MVMKKVLGAVGLEEGDTLTPEEQARQRRYEQYLNGWSWLRGMLDRHMTEYLTTGDSRKLEQLVASPVRERLFAHLDALRAQGLIWSMADRAHNSHTSAEIVHEDSGRDKTSIFVVREAFNDASLVREAAGRRQVRGDGSRRVLEARVICSSNTEFVLADVRQVDIDA